MNRRNFFALASVGAAPWLLPAAPKREGYDDAIDRGLLYLRRTQNPATGAWTAIRPGLGNAGLDGGDPALTALAVMAFMSAGHVPGEGPHGSAVEKGIRSVMSAQQRNGVIGAANGGAQEMYSHGISTLMLAEAAGMTGGPLADELNARLETAVKVILTAQRKRGVFTGEEGGWRYSVTGTDSDVSVTGWQLLALRAARNVGCDIPADRIQAAVEYVRRCRDPLSGGFRYTQRGRLTIACTGTGILALELAGKQYHRSPEVLAAGRYILGNDLQPEEHYFFYSVYYTSQAMFQLGDEYWKQYRPKLQNLLLRLNAPNGDGSWRGRSRDDDFWGPNYCTSMAILALTVEYRYLPIYQRFEEPIEVE